MSSLFSTRDKVGIDFSASTMRPEYAGLYPAIEPGVWMLASDVGRQLLLWHLTAASLPDAERVMSDEHFEFRGGHHRPTTDLEQRTRAADLRRQA